jgi:NADPH-dependent 2,4-dienoyl-CoA reductase/sulfur reductase-like enzyme
MADNNLNNTLIDIQRRRILQASACVSTLLSAKVSLARASKPPIGRVVIIGGGYAGTTAAKYIRMWSLGNIETIVVEQSTQFVSCPLSNLVLGGSKTIHDLTFNYDLVKKNHGIQWLNDTVLGVDTQAKRVRMARGELNYDRLIVAPGIDVNYEKIPNLAKSEAQEIIPHAWKAGWQTVNLRQQLTDMQNGGVFVMTVPKAPYRCPPGPYERACQVASYFKTHKPQSKVIVLDANPEITSKKGLFNQAFTTTYAGIVDYRPNNEIVSIDIPSKTVTTEFEQVKADVLNVIPPQRAGKVAQMMALNNIDNRWCEVDFLSYASSLDPNIHVIGDSVSAGLPKSAHMATSQARVCAAAIVALMSGDQPDPLPVFANTCYSFIDDKQAIHVAHVYRYDPLKKVMIAAEGGGVSVAPSAQEGQYAYAWANNIWSDVLT